MGCLPPGLVLVLSLVSLEARPKPPPERLSKEELAARGETWLAKERAKGVEATRACVVRHQTALKAGTPAHNAGNLGAAAFCFYDCGNFANAIRVWKVLVAEFPRSPEAAAAGRQLGPAYETIDDFAEAARWHRWYAKTFAAAGDAADRLTRAICIWRQLDATDLARSAFAELQVLAQPTGGKPAWNTLCADVPLVSPTKTTPERESN